MKYVSLLFLIFVTSAIFSQTSLIESSRYIEVSGSAEIEITPNKILIAAYLSERMEGKKKVDLSLIEKQFDDIVQRLGISKENISLDNAIGQYTRVRRRRSDVLASKVFLIEFSDVVLANNFLDALKDVDIANDIRKKTHTELARYRKETKIEAVKAAKAKAIYLTDAAGAKIGKVLRIVESNDTGFPVAIPTSQSYRRSSNVFNVSSLSEETTSDKFSAIKLRYEMDVIYEIID
ncbi:SIMPL domain-containing protein [uncultured Dokdonia sp.]|uniref:SIMPL domain-containing protein n=1 Tax=uncultured Dokdonia sp. TaxID=575653 RepID=UPI0026141CD9|nr:SIMPL domain-containing protein [uncultured Dokdonia sp.]